MRRPPIRRAVASLSWKRAESTMSASQSRTSTRRYVHMSDSSAVASSIAGTETNIDQVSLEERDVSSSSLKFQLQVRDRKHLARVIKTIRRMPDVQRVFRTLA